MAQGDVAPKRVLKIAGRGRRRRRGGSGDQPDFLNGRNNGILVYDRTAEGTAAPLRRRSAAGRSAA